MLFNSVHFLVFAPIVIFIFFIIPPKLQKWWLLVTSIYFYAVFKVTFLALLFFSIVLTYFVVIFHQKVQSKVAKYFWLNVAIFGNLSLLYFFKYIDFSFRAWNSILSLKPCDDFYAYPVGVILPMGISFFTLQAISYAIDVHRGVEQPAKNLFQFALYLSFFPQLVAGPIIRARDLMGEFLKKQTFEKENFYHGTRQIAWGFFKKTLVADPVAIAIDPIFANPLAYSGTSIWLAVYLFGVQVYCDFSGYSDIAIGTARIMGFKLPKNFDRPFFSSTIIELWRRWHISFSSWLRDYVYISLGGNKVNVYRAYFNVFFTTFISGIWHGADWTFIFWGTTQALVMVCERYIFQYKAIKEGWEKVPKFIRILYPTFIFALSLFFFRARPTEGFSSGLDVSFTMMGRAFQFSPGKDVNISISLIAVIFLLFGVEAFLEKNEDIFNWIMDRPLLFFSMCGIVIAVCFFIYSVAISQPFLYFQF